MRIPFYKMHGLGNDFVILETIRQPLHLSNSSIKLLADRHLGIGFDQLLVIESSTHADFACRIYNADGTEAEQCGNGMRCAARFLHEEHFISASSVTLATAAGTVAIEIDSYEKIRVNMGHPRFIPDDFHFVGEHKDSLLSSIQFSAKDVSVISMGNPHIILRVPSIKSFSLPELSTIIGRHPAFPLGVNIGFMEVVDRSHILLRTFERGVGETFACGSNACAAVVAGILQHELERCVTVKLKYGELLIEWQGDKNPVFLTGSATRVFSGMITLN